MATVNREYHWPVPKERVYYYAIEKPFADPSSFTQIPRVEKVKVLKDEGDIKKRYIKTDFFAKAAIPSALQNLIKPNMLGWIQEQWWDGDTFTLKVKVTPHFMANVMKITSEFSIKDKGDGTSIQHFSMTVKCGIPLLGGLLEKEILNQTLDSTEKMTKQDIEEAKKKG